MLWSCLTLCSPMDHSPPGSSVRGILQARILEWVVMSSSRGSPRPRIKLESLTSPALAGRFPPVGRGWLRGLCRLSDRSKWFLPTGRWGWILSFWWTETCQGVCLVSSCAGPEKIFKEIIAARFFNTAESQEDFRQPVC